MIDLQQVRDWENAALRLGFIGEAGVGKSSLINAILGRKVAQEGIVTVAHSPEGEEYEYKNVTLVDLPGCGSPDRPRETYLHDLKLLEGGRYDGFILVFGNRLKQDDVWLFEELHTKGKKPLFIVRNMFNLAIADKPEDEARREIEDHCRKWLKIEANFPVYMISSRHPTQYDLPKLIEDICNSLPTLKRGRLIGVVPAYTEKLVAEKREVAERIVVMYAAVAAANGLNPIPGLDITVDLGIMQKMTEAVIDAFGLGKEQLEYLSKLDGFGLSLDRMMKMAGPVLARLAREGVVELLKQAGTKAGKQMGKEAAKEGAKGMLKYAVRYAPIVGQLIGAGLNFAATYYYGKRLLDDCEQALLKIVGGFVGAKAAAPISPVM